VEYCCFNGEAFPRFNFTTNFQYGWHALSYVLVQVTVNVPLVRVKLLWTINGNPDSYSYSYLCLCEHSLSHWPKILSWWWHWWDDPTWENQKLATTLVTTYHVILWIIREAWCYWPCARTVRCRAENVIDLACYTACRVLRSVTVNFHACARSELGLLTINRLTG